MIHRLFVLSYFALPVGVYALRDLTVPWILIPAALLIAGTIFVLHRRKLCEAGRVLVASTEEGKESDRDCFLPYDRFGERAQALRRRYDEANLRLVNTNIQLLSVRELWQALAQPGRLEHTVDGALVYCHRASGFQEVMILRIEPRTRELTGRWLHPGHNGIVMESLRWAIGGLGGAVGRALRQPKSILADDASAQALITVNGESPTAIRDHGSYLVVPLLTPLPREECIEGGWLYDRDCPAFTPRQTKDTRWSESGAEGLDLSPCISCRHYPLYGLMVVTDRNRPSGIRKADQLTLESLSYAVSAVLQNASLYGEVKTAERFRDQILDGMTNGLLTVDERGQVVFANRRALEMLNRKMPEVSGMRLEEFLEVPDMEFLLQAALHEDRSMLRVEGRLGIEDADLCPVVINVAPFRREEGGMRGLILVIEDLSAVHAMQEEIRHLDTLAAIGRFASSMAHEIRNPLGGISAGMDYLRRGGRLGSEEIESVDIIQQEVLRLDQIIRNLFQVARPAKLEMVESDPVETLERAVKSLEKWAKDRGVSFEVQAPAALPHFHVDRDQIHQVLLNLLKNAVEASRSGQVVELNIDTLRDDKGAPLESDAMLFEVIDRGNGIAAEDLPQIFEPFFSRKAEGTGLGLFVCHNIVQRHGGVLQASSIPGVQTSFRVHLPLVPALIGGRS